MTNRLWVLGLSLVLLGACGDVCQDAVDKYEGCDLHVPDGLRQTECNECVATCASEASCDELSSDPQGADYVACVDDC